MNKRRLYISIVLMLLAIIAVAAFQLYWLNKNYKEEKQLLSIRTNILFREAVNQCQVEKLKLDSNSNNVDIRITSRDDAAVGMMNAIRRRVMVDTTRQVPKVKKALIISMGKEERTASVLNERIRGEVDSLEQTVRIYSRPGNPAWIQVLQGVDSLQDSVTIKEITARYSKFLTREKINLPFSISRKEETREAELLHPDIEKSNEVTIGFFRPLTFSVSIQNTGSYIFKRLLMPILVSLLLVSLTVISFVLMFRNLIKQRKLNQLKSDFVSNITHELKTPIATVGVAIEALRNFNAMNDPQRTKEYLDISAAEIQRLGLLVDKVLKLSMFENKEISFQKEHFDLLELTREVMASMKLQFEKHHAMASLESSGNDFVIEADKLHITSVIYNLLDNALKYSKEIPSIDVRLVAHEQHIALQVSDKGVGIPNEYKGKIFEKFFRVPGGDLHNIKGYGLGLSYVNHIIQRHMGFIEVKSELGKGSTFIVNIPYRLADVIRFDDHRLVRRKEWNIG